MHLMLKCPLYEAQREVMLRARGGIAGVAAVNAENMRMMVNGKNIQNGKLLHSISTRAISCALSSKGPAVSVVSVLQNGKVEDCF